MMMFIQSPRNSGNTYAIQSLINSCQVQPLKLKKRNQLEERHTANRQKDEWMNIPEGIENNLPFK